MQITAEQLNDIIFGMQYAEFYLQDHAGDSDRAQYTSDKADVDKALATIDQIIKSNED